VKLSGTTALLTGATGGLGRAIARSLAERGAHLVLSSRREAELERLASELPGTGHRVEVCDLAASGAGEELIARAGRLDVLIANAGLPASGGLEEFSPERLEAALRVNLEAPIRMARAAAGPMVQRGSGQLVFISSLNAKFAPPRASVYAATKFGLRGFALGLREDLHGSGVGVSLILPGFVRDAGMFHDSEVAAPWVFGTATPRQVGEASAEAILADRAETDVAPRRQSLGAAFAHRYPRLSARLTRRQAVAMAERVARGQSSKS